jgi:hypothetical protein
MVFIWELQFIPDFIPREISVEEKEKLIREISYRQIDFLKQVHKIATNIILRYISFPVDHKIRIALICKFDDTPDIQKRIEEINAILITIQYPFKFISDKNEVQLWLNLFGLDIKSICSVVKKEEIVHKNQIYLVYPFPLNFGTMSDFCKVLSIYKSNILFEVNLKPVIIRDEEKNYINECASKLVAQSESSRSSVGDMSTRTVDIQSKIGGDIYSFYLNELHNVFVVKITIASNLELSKGVYNALIAAIFCGQSHNNWDNRENDTRSTAGTYDICVNYPGTDVFNKALENIKNCSNDLFYEPTVSTTQGVNWFKQPCHRIRYLTNTKESLSFFHFPIATREGLPGFKVKPTTKYRLNYDVIYLNTLQTENLVEIGNIIESGNITDNKIAIETNEITKHGLIMGATGSGKTTTCFNILLQLWKKKIPFLVVESAKTEYRNFLSSNEFSDLKVFTLGDEFINPLRLNPFEIQVGFSIQVHVDRLKAVFNASMGLWEPLPSIIETCLYKVYIKAGFDLKEKNKGKISYPTMSDFMVVIDDYIEKLEYESKIKANVKEALHTRMKNFQMGSKGKMFNTKKSTSFEYIYQSPAVIEMENLGDDDDKVFVLGLILLNLSEYLKVKEELNEPSRGLKHITLFEEAHRLFRNVPLDKATSETANIRGKAVETFVNMLSEIRSYGEGFLIAEQIPTKLVPDVIKNTNLKIMHRLVAKDDRDVVGATMNLTEEQKEQIGILEEGEAAVFREGFYEPVLVKAPNLRKILKLKKITDTELKGLLNRQI